MDGEGIEARWVNSMTCVTCHQGHSEGVQVTPGKQSHLARGYAIVEVEMPVIGSSFIKEAT